jgi:hypothetical protein
MKALFRNSRKTECGAISSWIGSGVRAAPFALLISTTLLCLSCPIAFAQNKALVSVGLSTDSIPVQMVITSEPFRGSEAAPVSPGEVTVLQGQERFPVTEWLPLQGDKAGMELYILIDERVNPSEGMLFEQLTRFVSSQATATAVGIAYMHNGEANIVQNPTTEHARAAQALHAPSGNESADASPYLSLSRLINSWPSGKTLRREVLVITDGIDRFEYTGDFNVYVKQTIEDAQRAGVLVYCLYAPALGHASHTPALIHWGQTYLGQLAEETGGEAYLIGPEPPVSFEPFLADLAKQLSHQYRITFQATPVSGNGFQPVRFEAKVPNVELISAHRFYLKTQESLP